MNKVMLKRENRELKAKNDMLLLQDKETLELCFHIVEERDQALTRCDEMDEQITDLLHVNREIDDELQRAYACIGKMTVVNA